MRAATQPDGAWQSMVLKSMPPPAWLLDDAPDCDVVISSRVRYARNLFGRRFPNSAPAEELLAIEAQVRAAARRAGLGLERGKKLSPSERDHYVGSRMISPEFQYADPGRILLLDDRRCLSVMVNEEDHIRLQAVTAGWSALTAFRAASTAIRRLERHLRFAQSPELGYLTASPINVGQGSRTSALFHLIGLASAKRLPQILGALANQHLTVRGLFGESSRAVGAFLQVSQTQGDLSEFIGASEYLIREERAARRQLARNDLQTQALRALEFSTRSNEVALADAVRVLAWARWAAASSIEGFPTSYRLIDQWLSELEIHPRTDEKQANRSRAAFIRERFHR